MYRIGKKVSIGILCALFALAIAFVMAFALMPTNEPTAYADNTVNFSCTGSNYDFTKENSGIRVYSNSASSYYGARIGGSGDIFRITIVEGNQAIKSVVLGLTSGDANNVRADHGDLSGATIDNIYSREVSFTTSSDIARVGSVSVTTVDTSSVSYNLNGGSFDGAYQDWYVEGIGMTSLPTNVTKNGYVFKGWYDNSGLTGDPVTAIGTDATGAKGFWSKWLPAITYNLLNGVINGDYATEYVEGVGATLPTNVTQDDCDFAGWYDNANYEGEPVTAIGTDATGGKTYWAKWICSVTLNTNDGTINSGNVTEYIVGKGATLPTDITNGELVFAGWYDNASFEGDPVTTIGTDDRGPKEYWAKWVVHLHNYSTVNGYDETYHYYACTATIGACDAPVSDGEAHLYSDSIDTKAYFTCPVCGYEDAARKNAFYNTAVTLLDIDTNLRQKTYTKRNITVTVNIEGDEDGAGIIFDNNRMTITITGNVVFTDIWFEIGDFYDMNHANFRISSGSVYSDRSTGNDTGMIKAEYIYTKKVYAYTTDGWLHIKHLQISTMTVNAVTYELDGGSFNGEYIDYYRTHYGLTLPTNVSKSGYVFKGWYDNANFEGEPITAITSSDTGNKTFYAKWNRPITYNVNGGEIEGEYPTDYAPGVGATLPTTVTKEGYAFGGWWDNATFEGDPITTITTEDTDEKTYWARWYPIGYHIIGSMTDWKVDEKYLLTKNTAVTDIDEYYIELTIAAGAEFKVVHGNAVYGGEGVKNTWYPEGTDNSYTVSENGFYRVYFRPDGNGESGWYENVLLAKRLFAQVNGTNYHTIADAYAVVTAGGTIKLVDDLDLSGAVDCLDVTKNVTIDLNGFILDITTSTDPKIAVNGGAVITIDDSSDDIGGVKGACDVDSEKGSYIVLKNCRLSLDATAVRFGWRINNTATGYVVRSIEGAPDADGFVTIVRQGTDQEIADDVVELIDAIGTVEATTTSKQKINDARERYDALTSEQKELVAEAKRTTLEEAEAQYIQLVVDTINALPAVGSIVCEDKPKVENARALYEMLTDTEKTAFSAEALAKLQAAEVDIADCEAARAVENRIEALPSTILFEHNDDVARVRVAYDALTAYQKGKVPTATYNKLSAAEAEIAEWNVAMMVTAQIEGLPAAEEITIDNKTRIESARAKYDALTGTVKDKVTAETVSKLEAAENSWAAMKAASDAADVVEAAIAAIGKLERSEACQQKIADAREQYNNLTDLQKSLVDNYSTLVYAENKYAAYVAAADAVIGKINAIGTVENTEESKEKIDEARAAFNALLTEVKEFVTNYDVLAAAESAYDAFTPIENVAEIGETKYTTVLEALTAAEKGETVKLLTDIDLSDKEKAYITLRRDITIDLNGHELNVTSASLTYIIWASDGAVITINNSVPEQGGIKGLLGADYLSGAKIVLINCRLTVSVLEFTEYDAFLSIGDDCVMKDLNSGKMSVVGYVSVVRPIGDQDLADDVIDLIKAIKEIELTEECNALIIAAREAYDALTDEQKALVENFSVLTSAESAYAALATAKFEALPASDAITIADKSNVETARAIYDSLTDAEKAYVPAETVTKLTDAEAALAVILEDYILAGDDCIHRSVQITDIYVSSSALTQSSYSDPDIQNGHEGIKIKFKKNGARTQTGTAIVTVKIALAEAHEVEIWWKFDYEGNKHTCSLKYTHDSENWVSAPTNAEWKVDRVYLEAGTYTFQYQCGIGQKNPLSSEYKDRYFYVVPMFFPSFDDNCICTLCGTECLHETVSVAYDAEKNDYHFVCEDSCFKTIDLNAISFDQETSFETARAAYDALTDEQKAMFRPSDLFKLEAHEMKVAEIEAEQNAVNDEKTAFKVTELINGLPQTDEVTLTDYVVIQETRAAYEALTAKQKTYVTTATLARLTDVEEKYTQIKANADAEEKDAVIALINALPVGDAITFEKRSLIEQAGVAYNMLTSAQKGQITTETKNVLSAAELRGVIVSWEDFFPEDGTYILVSATDESKAIVRIDKDTIQIGTYGDMDVNDPDVATANNRDFKWKIVRQGENAFYTLINIFYTGANERLLDVGSWEEQLGDGSNLGLVVTDAAKGEHETNVFRFSKRKGVDMEEDEYYIRAVSTLCDKYNFTITLRTGDSVNIGTYVAKNGGQVWKLVRVKGDEEFAKEVIDQIAALPTYDDTVLDDESDIVAVREAYTALNEYQKTLVSNLDYLVSAEQKIVDIKAANAVDDEITAIGTVEDTAASKAKVDEVRAAYNAITDAQRLLVTKLETLVAAETACADFVTAAIEAIPASAEITINNITAINAARAKYEALTPEEKTHVTQATIDKLSAAEVTITVISLPAVGVLTLENKAAVVAARAEYTALTAGAKEVFGVLETLVAAETEIADIEAAKAVTDAITALPEIANITVGDSDAVMEVVTAYNALSPYQQGKVPADKINKLFAEKMSIVILALPAYDDITLEHETVVNDAYDAYLALPDDQRQLMLADVTTKLTSEKKKIDDMNAAKAVTNLIEAIGEVEYTDESKDKIDTARIQYNGLTDEQKAFVTAETLTILTDAEKEYADAANEAIYAKLSKDIDELTDEDKEYIAEAKATYDDLTDEEKDLIPQGTKDKLFASVTTIAVLEIPDADEIDEDITDEDANKIKAAKEMYDELTPEQQALMPEDAVNKVLASAVTLDIVELPATDEITIDDKTDILAAKEAFDELTPEQQDLIPQTKKDVLEASVTTVAIVEIPVVTDIDEDITDEEANKIKAAKEMYDDLTPEQQALVPEEVVNKVFASDTVLTIVELTDTDEITADDKEAIEAARAKYDSLTGDQKDLIPSDIVDTLIASEAVLDIVELPVGTDITTEDKTDIQAARTAYNVLTPEQKEKVTQDTVNTLIAAETTLTIVELPENKDITAEDEDAIVAAREAYEGLEDGPKAKVAQGTVDTLIAAETTLKIVKLPAIEDVTVDDKAAILAVKAEYDDLTDDQKAKVAQGSKDKLFVSEATIAGMEIIDATDVDEDITDENANAIIAAKALYDNLSEEQKDMMSDTIETKVLVSMTTLAIIKLPNPEDVTADDAEAVMKARELYNALSDEQKAMISPENEDKLLAATATIVGISVPEAGNVNEEITQEDADAIKAAKEAYDDLTDEQKEKVPEDTRNKLLAASAALDIIELPDTDDITTGDKDAIEKARKAYNELDETQRGLIPQGTVDTLIASEAVLDIVELPVGTDITTEDKTDIQAAREAYDKLTEDQKEKVPQDTVDTLVAAEAVLDIVELPVGTDISTEDKTDIQAARAAYEELSEDQKKKVPQDTVDTLVAAETVLTIVELPVIEDITAEDDTVILAAKEAYEELSEDQKKKVPQDTVNRLYASVTTVTVVEISDADEIDEDITDEKADAIKAAKEMYDELTPEQQALMPEDAVNKVLASAVTLDIVELPATDEITIDDKTDILAAKEAFDELTPEQQDLIPQTKKDVLEASVTTVAIVEIPVATDIDEDITDEDANKIKAAKEMYDDLTPEQQALVPEEVVNKVFASDTVLTIVELTDTDEITADDKEAIEAARAKYDSLTGDQKDLIPSDIVDTLIASEAVLDIVELPVGTDITTEDKTDIQAARTAYNALTPEQKEKVPQDTVDTLVAAEAVLGIVELPIGLDISEDDEDEIVAARAAYEELSEDQKKKVPQDTVDTLCAAEAVLTIVELPTITLIEAEDEDAIVAARAAYDKLTDDQKKKVPQDTVDTLAASESTLVIVKLPDEEELKADDKDAIIAARAAYEKLTDEQKENVPQASKDKLIASEVVLEIIELTDTDEISPEDEEAIVAARAAYEELSEKQKNRVPKDIVDTLCASEAILDIVELPVVLDISEDDEDSIVAAREAYDKLTDDQKKKVPQDTVDTLVAAEAVLGIVELPIGLDISEDDEDSIVAAREAFDKLTEDQKKKVPQDTVDTLCAAEAVLTIVELPIGTDISEDDEDAIVAARAAYEELSEDQKKKVPQDTVDTLCAAETVLTIVELPVVGELTLEDKSDVEAARAAYDKLSDDQKKKVPQDTVDALVAAETEIADIEAAKETTDAIVALPSSAETTREDREDVVAAREAYDKLTPYQQSKVPEETVAKLVAAEEIFVALDKIDAIGEVAYTPETKALIDSAKESYDGLSDEQKEAITNADKLQKADTDYNAVDEVVTKIEAITDIRYDERSGSAIEGARQEYSTLTTDQQAMLFASSYQKLVDAEMVYETLGKIDAIGKVEYSEESKDLIDEAREYYDALSDEQKALINVQDVETLTVSEETYTEKDNGAKATYTALLVIVGVLLAAGLLVLAGMVYLQLKGKKKKGTKTFSVFFLPLLLGATHYIDSPFIALYVLAAVTLIVFVAIIVLAVKNPNLIKGLKTIVKKENKEEKVSEQEEKKAEPVAPIVVQEAPKQETPVAVATTAEEVSLAQDEGDEDGGVVVDAKGNYFNIRYNKSFTAKLIQSSDETKGYYGELKNEILSYAKAKSRVSWAYDSVNAGREAVAKFGVRGKTLCLYLPLKAEELDEKYKVEAIESAKYAAVPCMYRIKNERRLRYAKELIATACNALGLEKGETKGENYYLPFESTEALVKKNLVKELTVAATSTQIEKAKTEGTIRIVESVSATEVNDLISTEIAAAAITESDTHATGKKGIVNVDTLSMQYNAGDTVTVESLHEKKLIAPGVKQVKLLARGVLDKKLHVELQDYSIEAVKMILATGGTVKKA